MCFSEKQLLALSLVLSNDIKADYPQPFSLAAVPEPVHPWELGQSMTNSHFQGFLWGWWLLCCCWAPSRCLSLFWQGWAPRQWAEDVASERVKSIRKRWTWILQDTDNYLVFSVDEVIYFLLTLHIRNLRVDTFASGLDPLFPLVLHFKLLQNQIVSPKISASGFVSMKVITGSKHWFFYKFFHLQNSLKVYLETKAACAVFKSSRAWMESSGAETPQELCVNTAHSVVTES